MNDFVDRLVICPKGIAGWKAFEDLCIEVFCYLFVPPLHLPIIQARSYSGIDRRVAVFPDRNFGVSNNWGYLLQELNDAIPNVV